jgi:hypothetical protein
VRFHFDRFTFAPISLPGILHVSQRFLLFGVNGDRRFATPAARFDAARNEFKLSVSVGVLLALYSFSVRLEAVTLGLQ